VWFQKISIPRTEGHWKFSGGGGLILKTKIFKATYEPKLEFPEWRGVQTNKSLYGGSMDISWNNTMYGKVP